MVILHTNIRVGDKIWVRGPRDWEVTKVTWIADNRLTLCDSLGRYHNTLEVSLVTTRFARQLAMIHFIDGSKLAILIHSLGVQLTPDGEYEIVYWTPNGDEEQRTPRDVIRSITFGDQ
jgi:hypothetical protein